MDNLPALKKKLELVEVKNRQVSPYGFRHTLMQEHLEKHLGQVSNQWCEIGCLTRTMEGRNSETNRRAMRKRLTFAFKWFLDRGIFLVVDKEPHGQGHHGEAKAVKIYTQTGQMTLELQAAQEQLERMVRRREISQERCIRAREILGIAN